MKRTLLYIVSMLFLAACGENTPHSTSGAVSSMFPDYTGIVLPCNIAPLNFQVEGADALRLEIRGNGAYHFRARGSEMRFPMKKWREMLRQENGRRLELSLEARFGRETVRYETFTWEISADSRNANAVTRGKISMRMRPYAHGLRWSCGQREANGQREW